MSETPKYVEIRPCDRDEFEAAVKSHDATVVSDALYSTAQHEADWRWSQEQCLEMLDHESLLVRSTALIALGEIALFRGHLDVETVLPEIHRVASDPVLAPFAQDALDNIRAAKLRQ